MNGPEHRLALWGTLGGLVAATFAVRLIAFPETVATRFAWDVHPRAAQLFVGAGYLFRTAFFFAIARERRWTRVRWMFWGNIVFTGTLLLATYWHADEFTWGQFVPPTAHFWILLYIFEPVAMLYLVPRGEAARAPAPSSGGPVLVWFRRFLVFEAGILLMMGLLLVINPEFAAARWPWELNPLDARMVAAWFLGWSAWTGTMAFAEDWDEIRLAARLNIINGLALSATIVVLFSSFDFTPARAHPFFYILGVLVFTIGMLAFHVLQERRRPRVTTEVSVEVTA
jgi:hypothetical protein